MKILMRLDPDLRSDDPADDVLTAFGIAKSALDDSRTVGDSYLMEPPYSETAAEFLQFTDGAENPSEILDTARKWNADVIAGFERTLSALVSAAGKNHDWLSCPNQLYELRKAVTALDNTFYDFADTALLVDPAGGFTGILKDEQLLDIEENTENYVQITVYVK